MQWLYLIAAFAGLVIIYFFLIFPSSGKKAKVFEGRYIAHRGLHGGGITENTMPAFSAAIKKGYGIELDVQLSSDGVPVVCHDCDLKRVFGVDKKVKELTESELNSLGVPSFSAVLELIDGRVPLVTEIKGEDLNTSVCEKAAELLDRYDGLYCVESFNPFYLHWFKKRRKNVIRGQLSTAFGKKRDGKINVLHFFLRHLLLNFLSRPNFIAYEHKYFGISARLCRSFGALMVCWTPASKDELNKAKKHYNTFIFEGFEP